MAIEKVTTYNMEIVDDYSIQVRTRDAYVEDGVEISINIHRHVVRPIDDWSSEPQTVQNFADALFTNELKAEYDAYILANEPKPYPSWTMSGGRWTPPESKPDDGKEYRWNEETQAWDGT